MNKNLSNPTVLVAAIIAVASLVVGMGASIQKKTALTEVQALRDQISRMQAYVPDADGALPTVNQASSTDTNELAILRNLLAERDAELASLKVDPESTQEEERPPRESWEDRMTRMKEEEPEEYAEMIKRREERQTEMRYNLAERTATFMDLDTSNMTEEERANHELLVEKMANVWALTEQFQDPEAAPDREAMRELFTAAQEVRPLMRDERTVMFKQLGADLGYEGKDAQDFADHIEDLIDATTLQMPGRGSGGRGGGGGDR